MEAWGYELKLLPGARSQLAWITEQEGSNRLTNPHARVILQDLKGDLLQLQRITRPVSAESHVSSPPSKRRRTQRLYERSDSGSETEEEE